MMENVEEFQKLLVGAGITEKCPLGQFSKQQARWLTEYVMSRCESDSSILLIKI